ncbi:MAG: hypothetical protein P1U56_24875 [Saprospiraceae bacterium]|nr:hypothetical protein [Saprospiraceae bacterium]
MKPGESYDEWHRRTNPGLYIWENFQYPKVGRSENQSVCSIPITIMGCEICELIVDHPQLSETHKKTIDTLLTNQHQFVEDIRTHTFEYYTFQWHNYLNEYEDDDTYPHPSQMNPTKMDTMITPKTIHMASTIAEGSFGMLFRTTLDLSHGLGLRFKNYKVEEVGGEDIGFSLLPDS